MRRSNRGLRCSCLRSVSRRGLVVQCHCLGIRAGTAVQGGPGGRGDDIGRHNSFPPLDLRLLHLHRAMCAVQFVVEPTRIANRVTVLVAAPQRRDRRPAILARHHDVRRVRGLEWVPVRCRFMGASGRGLM